MIRVFYGCYLSPGWQALVTEQLAKLTASGLAEAAVVTVCATGTVEAIAEARSLCSGIDEFCSTTENQFEYFALTLVHECAKSHPDDIFCYFHTKGSTSDTGAWRKLLDHYNVVCWRKAAQLLEDNDAVGPLLCGNGEYDIFAGNFFWAKGTFLASLPPPAAHRDRFAAEMWLGWDFGAEKKVAGKFASLYPAAPIDRAQLGDILQTWKYTEELHGLIGGKRVPVYINNRDRLTTTKALVEQLKLCDLATPVIVDNASTYPPLLEWYATNPCEVILLGRNAGPYAVWQLPEERRADYFAVTDSDLDIAAVPLDVLPHLLTAVRIYPNIGKVGLSLEIDDLPDTEVAHKVRNWEGRFWIRRYDDKFWEAEIDTTFAVYAPNSKCHEGQFTMLRADRPYTARHVPWYLTPDTLTEEEQYYTDHADHVWASWVDRINSGLDTTIALATPIVHVPTDAGTSLGVVIPCRNQLPYTQLCVNSLCTHAKYEFRVILIDNECTDGTVDWVRAKCAAEGVPCTILPLAGTNLSRAWNMGVYTSIAQGCNLVAVINNDVVVGPAWDECFYQHFAANAATWCAVPHPACVASDSNKYTTDPGAFLWRLGFGTGEYMPGYFMVFQSRAFYELGMFNEHYRIWYGETEMCKRLVWSGHPPAYLNCPIVHFGRKTTDTVPAFDKIIAEDKMRFFAIYKHL
jgi:GT2 family glycosyltransferase